jgi:hypothetical protein
MDPATSSSAVCSHAHASTSMARLTMLVSADGVRCYACGARVRLPSRVRWGVAATFLAATALAFVTPYLGVAVGLVTLPLCSWVRGAGLEAGSS